MTVFTYVLIALISYLIGSFSTGISFSRRHGRDLREEGSKSSGATNAFRVMGARFGLLTFLGDFLKATLALWAGKLLGGQPGAMAAGIFVILGHNWPVYYRFRGGKGIACSIAVLFWIFPLQSLAAFLLASIVVVITKYVSLGSLVFILLSAVFITVYNGFIPYGLWVAILFALAVFQHRANLNRLLNGEENKLRLRRSV